jgi:hypothetical protein
MLYQKQINFLLQSKYLIYEAIINFEKYWTYNSSLPVWLQVKYKKWTPG